MKRFVWNLGFGVWCLWVSSNTPIYAQPSVSIRTEVTPREIYIGDPISYGVIVTVSSDVASTPISPPEKWGEFELLNASSPTMTMGKDGKNTIVCNFSITTFSTGSLAIPALPIQFSAGNNQVLESKTEEVTIKVRSLLAEKGDLGNILPLKGLFNFKSYLWVWILMGVLVGGIVGYFLWKWMRQKEREKRGLQSGPPRPPEEVAWEAIHALEDAELIAGGQTKEFYYRLSVILRQYLENRYKFSALERTSSELLAEFRRRKFSTELTNLCRDFFDNADLVKFAKFMPAEEDVTIDLNRVKKFVNTTTPQKPEPERKEAIPV